MEVPIIKSPDQKAAEAAQRVQAFSENLSLLLQQAILDIPINTVMKVMSNHQTDLQCVYMQALMQAQFQAGLAAAQESLNAEPTPES